MPLPIRVSALLLVVLLSLPPVATSAKKKGAGEGDEPSPHSVGYWKNHPEATQAGLPQDLGDLEIATAELAGDVFDESRARNAHDKLAAQLLAAKLNLELGVQSCVTFVVERGDAILAGAGYAGPDTTTAPSGEEKEGVLAYAELLDQFNNTGCPLVVPDQVVVKFAPDVPQELVLGLIQDCGTLILSNTNRLVEFGADSPFATGEVDPAIKALLQNIYLLDASGSGASIREVISCFEAQPALVESAQPNYYRFPTSHQTPAYPSDPRFMDGSQWALHNAGQKTHFSRIPRIDADIDILQAWRSGATDCSSVIVAVEDTGADLAHPDLVNNLWVNPNEIAGNGEDDDENGFVDDVHGWDWRDTGLFDLTFGDTVEDSNGDGPQDTFGSFFDGGHGTAVAGIIGAEGNNGIDMAGICWKAQLMIIRYGLLFGGTTMDILYTATYLVTQKSRFGHNIRVLNQSFGGGAVVSLVERNVYRAYELSDILVIKAVTNEDVDIDADEDEDGEPDFSDYPCNSTDRTPNIICVTTSDQNDQSPFNGTGTRSVDLAAPGIQILTLRRTVDGGGTTPAEEFGGKSGTSYAAPHVSGVAALAFSLFPGKSAVEVKNDILFGSLGPPAASGVDRVRIGEFSSPDRTLSGGRLRWPYTGDLGDAPSSYGTRLADQGPLHWDVGNEFFGEDVTAELDAQLGGDPADQPLVGGGQFVFAPEPPWVPRSQVGVSYQLCSDYADADDITLGRYRALTLGDDEDVTLYVNAWFDLDGDGAFGLGELLLKDLICTDCPALPAPPANPNVTVNQHPILPVPANDDPPFPPVTRCFTVNSSFLVPDPGGVPAAVRFRLDYGEDIGDNDPEGLFLADQSQPAAQHLGRARHGEVEDFTLEADPGTPPFSITGTVIRLQDGLPVPDATVRVRDETGGVVRESTTGADGSYRLDGLEPGLYDVEVIPPPGSGLEPDGQAIDLRLDATIDFALGESASADLSVLLNVPPTVLAGTPLFVDATLQNLGSDPATAPSLSIHLDPVVLAPFVSPGPGISCLPDDNGFLCTAGSLAPGDFFTVFVGGTVPDGTPDGQILVTRAAAASATFDPDPGNDSQVGTTVVVAPAGADLGVVISAPPTVFAGGTLPVEVTVQNLGPDTAVPASVVILLDPLLSDPFPSPGLGVICDPVAGGFSCGVPSLAAGDSFVVFVGSTIDPATPDGTPLTAQATASSTTADPDAANNTATSVSVVQGVP